MKYRFFLLFLLVERVYSIWHSVYFKPHELSARRKRAATVTVRFLAMDPSTSASSRRFWETWWEQLVSLPALALFQGAEREAPAVWQREVPEFWATADWLCYFWLVTSPWSSTLCSVPRAFIPSSGERCENGLRENTRGSGPQGMSRGGCSIHSGSSRFCY